MKNIKPLTVIRVGIALVFLANSFNAFWHPAELVELIKGSYLSSIIPLPVKDFVTVIGINDFLVSLLFFLNVRWVSVWAMVWIIGVMTVKGLSLETLEESGFLFMALALFLDWKNNK